MVPAPTMHTSYHNNEHALHSAALELKYAHSTHLVDIISKEEDLRRLRFDLHILGDDNDELHELLGKEQDRSDAFEKLVTDNLARAEEAEAQVWELQADLRRVEQEVQALFAEKNALQHSSEDATAALTEKLALTRELSVLRPELEHLKAQAASSEVLMTEKLALQRQLSNIQCDLENAKREAQRALAKRRNTGVEIAQEEQMEDLKRQLAKEKRARQRAEESADTTSGDVDVDELRKQLNKERKARQKAEEQLEAAQDSTQVEDVRKDLLREKKAKAKLEESLEAAHADLQQERKAAARATKRAEGNAQADDEAEELRNELAKEKKERAKAEKTAQQAAAEFEAQKATLDDKIVQFRNKLKTTKEKLKETESELVVAREAAAAAATVEKTTTSKQSTAAAKSKKRNAAQMDPDATNLGTPGDGPALKRGRKAAAGTGVGDKSTFTLTPFLNKTTSVIQEEDDDEDGSDANITPSAQKTAKQPLAQQPANSLNVPTKATTAVRKTKPALEMVTEENEPEDVHKQGQENIAPKPKATKGQTLKLKTKTTDGPDTTTTTTGDPTKQRPKFRKSLADFATFNPEPDVEKKKKRKLGGLGKTLFDEEEAESTAPSRGLAAAGRGLFGMKGFGGAGKKKGGLGTSFLGGSRAAAAAAGGGGASMLMTAGDGSGFVFSPLKKARRNLDDTLRG